MITRRAQRLHIGLAWGLAAGLLLATASAARAGGSPENMLLIIDPSDDTSMYIGNYYKDARDVPDNNVLYMTQIGYSYPAFISFNLDPLFGTLANAEIDDHIDYVVVMPSYRFYIYAPGYVSDACYAVTRFSISSGYTMAFIADEILDGLTSTTSNRYYSSTNYARAFDSSTGWYMGSPSTSPYARRYFIGAMLGYTGERGNTIEEILDLVDRSVAADGTRPAGTFYYMNNTADPDRNVRWTQFSGAVSAIQSIGGQAQIIYGVLPTGQHDCLGIMTGAANPGILTEDFTLLDGAFCDHLTSWAAKFDTASQTKVSAWIIKGASGSWGTVEEPCNYTGKFPHARMHRYYFEGSSLGEAAFRSAQYTPFQSLLYGDPLTRPFAHIPSVTASGLPPDPVSGFVNLTPAAMTSHPTATISHFDLLIDGVFYDQVDPGLSFTVDTTQLADGWHDLRVLAYDNSLVASTGRWLNSCTIDNRGRSVSLVPYGLSGDWATQFDFDITAFGDTPREVRLVQNGRVVAAAPGASATLSVHGLALGAGPVRVHAEAFYCDGRIVSSAPVTLEVDYDPGMPSAAPPLAYGYTKRVLPNQPFIVELPATFDDSTVPLTYQIVSPPAKATVPGALTGPYRIMHPLPDAAGVDTFTFRVSSAAGNSDVVTVTLVYDWQDFGDLTCDGVVDFDDYAVFEDCLNGPDVSTPPPGCDPEDFARADLDGDNDVDLVDFTYFQSACTGE
ncbi:MAG: TIGR03790 family protein [Phycisphaerae bacterium]|nr:TIGR03790 family protein [Phycisphaerae bacterium]